MKGEIVTARLNVASLIPTNETLSEDAIQKYQQKIRGGMLETLGNLFVAIIPGLGYCVNDGNHRHAALTREGVNAVDCDVYSLDN